MWHVAVAIPQRRFGNFAKVLQAQNHKGLYQPVGGMPQVWDDIRASYNHPPTPRTQDHRRQSVLEIERTTKWKKQQSLNPLHGLHVKKQDILNRIQETKRALKQLEAAQQLVEFKINQSTGKKDLEWATAQSAKLNLTQETVDDLTNKSFTWSDEVKSKMNQIFNMDNFRPQQLEAINATMSNRDVILVTSTGGGKSLCYQLPALLSTGITVVVSPLVSLIEDQILNLRRCGISAKMLSSNTTADEALEIYHGMESNNPDFKLLYLTPEKISKSKTLMSQLDKCYKANNLSRFAIDEVHCVSMWGNDFRPDYKYLGILKKQFRTVPIIGLTASATKKVTEDTKEILNIENAVVLRAPLHRPNLFYEVRPKPESHQKVVRDMADTINQHFKDESGLVYCLSRRNCTDVCKGLSDRGISAAVYHARMSAQDKRAVHNAWANDEIKVLCSTVAFGMGINKSDVRFVIHHSMSKNFETYFQESGRAGRDGQPALCLLYMGFNDVFRLCSMVFDENLGPQNLDKMLSYCSSSTTCRHEFIGSHFSEENDKIQCNGMCDICAGLQKKSTRDVTQACRALLDIVKANKGAFEDLTANKLVERAGKLSSAHPDLASLAKVDLQMILLHMLKEQYLGLEYCFTRYRKVPYLVAGPRSRHMEKVVVSFCTQSPSTSQVYSQRLGTKLS